MYKLKLFLLPVALLLAFMALACAPPDDDAPSSGPSKSTINNAIYDFATALLTVQGSNLSPTEAQIQTIVVDGVALDSYTADDPATGPDSRSLAKGKYRIKSDGTALWLKLTDRHKATLNGKKGMDSNGLKKGLLSVGSGAWAGLNTAKDLDVSNVPDKQSETEAEDKSPKQPKDKQVEQAEEESPKQPKDKQVEQAEEESPKQPKDEQVEQAEQVEQQSPELPEAEQTEQVEDQQSKTETEEAAITRASYNVGTALLTLQGSNLNATSATQAQIQTIVVDGLALSSYIADATATGPDSRGLAKGKYRIKSDGTALWLYLTDRHKATLNGKTGMDSNGLKDGLLSVGTGTWAGLNTAKALAVSGHPPAITSATYNANTGVLVITGTNLPKAVTGWDFSKLTLVSGDGKKKYTLSQDNYLVKGSAASATSLTITLTGSEQLKAGAILVKNGDSDDTGAYNLEASAGFAGGRAEDTSNNPITVSGYVSYIDEVYYNANTGLLQIRGGRLPTTIAEWDFSKLTLVSGDGKKRYTLPQHATAGVNRAEGSTASTKKLLITLSGSIKAEVEKILVKAGYSDDNGEYKLEGAAGFTMGSPEDSTTSSIYKF